MRKDRKLIAQATKLSSFDLQHILSQSSRSLPSANYQLEIFHANELSTQFQQDIVDLFEKNMKNFYEQSLAGYQPDDKRKELFDEQARYLLIRSSDTLVAFTHFRFDMDYGSRVVYLYELQVNENFQGQGLGKWIIEQLQHLGQQTQMSKIVLTVHQSNQQAIDFYMKKCAFTLDITHSEDDSVDYFILSCPIQL